MELRNFLHMNNSNTAQQEQQEALREGVHYLQYSRTIVNVTKCVIIQQQGQVQISQVEKMNQQGSIPANQPIRLVISQKRC